MIDEVWAKGNCALLSPLLDGWLGLSAKLLGQMR